jgi:hypothetical protein
MNALTEITALTPEQRCRRDGWTPDRQRAFLEAIAEGHTVDAAARLVGMTKQSAYVLRRRAAGSSFALGWAAASLLARETIADALIVRALDGQVETWTRADGSTVSRHRYDNALASRMLARLDRAVEEAPGPEAHAARLVAREFDAFLDLIDRDAGPARAGLFLAGRAADGEDPDLDSIVALARADRWLKAGAGTPTEIDAHDLDPDARATWTADQWARAEAAGLVTLAGSTDTAQSRQLGQLCPENDDESGNCELLDEEDEEEEDRVWWDQHCDCWRTNFPPPPDFDGAEDGTFGDDDYERDLTAAEDAAATARHEAALAAARAEDAAARDRWFALAEDTAAPTAPDDDTADDDADAAERPDADEPADDAPVIQPARATHGPAVHSAELLFSRQTPT